MKAPTPITQTIQLPDGRTITLETGRMARQADGAVLVRSGGTALLATVVSNKEARPGLDWLPLTVEYKEKFAAAGRVPGGFLKREGRPNDREILVCRLVDRVLRPLFPKDYHAEVQVIITLFSYDENVAADSLAGLAASAAIAVSDIPFNGPMSEVNVARINGEFVINPSYAQLETADMEIMMGATADSVTMVEGEMDEVSEKEMLEAIKIGHEVIKTQIEGQLALAAMVPTSSPKRVYSHEVHDEDLRKAIKDATYDATYAVAGKAIADKHERSAAFKQVMTDFVATLSEEEAAEKESLIRNYYHDVEALAVRNQVLDNGLRLDGRKTDEIRPIWSEVDLLPGPHGCALFTRGETQSLTTVTLGSKMDSNRIDAATMIGDEKFYLHYNFPPFSTGEARMMRGTSRREIGHGNLAQRALKRMVPASSGYTIRVVSEILESNGSSSMATVCAGSMAMMDAGLEIIRPVSGIAMGLITDQKTGKFAVLSDILGDEDHLGDMDFKVTGTEKGITACQMDIKVKGLSYEILETALMQANVGRKHISREMAKTIDAPRAELKPHTPKMVVMEIPKEYIGGVIGPGGKIIQGIQADTNTTITLEEIDEVGRIEISGTDADGLAKAQSIIKEICFVPEVGTTYDGVVKGVQTFGVFVEIGRNKEGLLHVSEMAWERVEDPADLYKEGDKVTVKLIGTDKGKLRLSRKVLLEKPEGYVERPSRPRGERSDRGDRRGRDDRRGRGGDRRRDDRGGDRRRDDRNDKPRSEKPREDKPRSEKPREDKPREDNRGARGSQNDERGNLGEEMKSNKPSED